MKKPSIQIREEQPADVEAIRGVNRQAFDRHREGGIVDTLRGRGAVLVSLVALVSDEVVGHIFFSPAMIGTVQGAALGPMAVLPAHQRQGIGSQLIVRGLERLQAQRCPAVVVVGHPRFYPRFGFEPATRWRLTCDWELPAGVFMVKVLDHAGAGNIRGHVVYQPEFATGT